MTNHLPDLPDGARTYEFDVRGRAVRATPWPKIGLWQKGDEGWKEIFPAFALLCRAEPSDPAPDIARRVAKNVAEFNAWLREVPPEVLGEARRYGNEAYRLLRFFSIGQEAAIELSRGRHEALCIALAHAEAFRRPGGPLTAEEASAVLTLPHHEIARWLGFDAGRAGIRILERAHVLDTEASPKNFLLSLRECMKDREALKKLCDIPAVNESILAVLSWGIAHAVTINFLSELLPLSRLEDIQFLQERSPPDCPEDSRGLALIILFDGLRIWNDMGRVHPLPSFNTLADAYHFHDQMLDLYLEIEADQKLRALVFPEPPFAGTAEIVPITDPCELLQEGEECQHYSAALAKDVAARQTYIYKVFAPERATLLLRRSGDKWRIAEIRTCGSLRLSRKVRRAVDQWLSEAEQRWPRPHLSSASYSTYRRGN